MRIRGFYFAACLSFVSFLVPTSSAAQTTALHTPPRGSAERKAILDALRSQNGDPSQVDTVYVVGHLKVKDGWAWVEAEPMSRDGKQHYESLSALLHLENGKWTIKGYAPGECTGDATDSPDCNAEHLFKRLIVDYGAPSEIFPFSQKKVKSTGSKTN